MSSLPIYCILPLQLAWAAFYESAYIMNFFLWPAGFVRAAFYDSADLSECLTRPFCEMKKAACRVLNFIFYREVNCGFSRVDFPMLSASPIIGLS